MFSGLIRSLNKCASLWERRRLPRFVESRTAWCAWGGRIQSSRVLDRSAAGLRVTLSEPVPVGSLVQFSSPGGDPDRTYEVCWSSERDSRWEAGLRLLSGSELRTGRRPARPRAQADVKARRARRFRLFLPSELRLSSGLTLGKGFTVDLGMDGALLNLDRAVPAGLLCRLAVGPGENFPRLLLYCRVVSCREHAPALSERGRFLCHLQMLGRTPAQLRELSQNLSLLAPGASKGVPPRPNL